jgi:ATP-binding cassette, subfamily B, bacterial
VRAKYLPAIDLLPSLGQIAVLGVGGYRVLDGHLTIGALVAFNFYVALLVWPLRTIGMTIAFGQRAAAALERVHEVLSTVPEIVDPRRHGCCRGAGAHIGDVRQPGPLGGVVPAARRRRSGDASTRVTFGYDPGEPILRGFDLEIPAGGPWHRRGTGSGKSTVARLLLRFYDPQRGTVSIDGIDLRDLAVRDAAACGRRGVRGHAAVPRHRVREHRIRVSRRRPATIRRARELAGADDFIEQLPDGYDTLLGERGYSLSGGQRQRIAIARAIVADPRILVLDDATSAVDPSKEHEIRAAMESVMHGRTTLVIAHRPGTIAIADAVVLLDDGRVAPPAPTRAARHRAPLSRGAGHDGRPTGSSSGAHHRVDGDADGRRVVGDMWATHAVE